MPAKKSAITDEERARRIRETAREVEADPSPKAFDRAFKKVVPRVRRKPKHKSPESG